MGVLKNKDLLNNQIEKIKRDNEIIKLIRERYSPDEECAILRKKLAGLDNGEFEIYNSFVEECKNKVKGGAK